MKLKAPAKINWTLRVLGRRPDGFHELQSWFVPLDLADTLEGNAGETSLRISGPCADAIPGDSDNLIFVAEEKWRLAGGVAPAVTWDLRKEIPTGAGLGGGSSDAAAALNILQGLATNPLDGKVFQKVAAEVGSDVPFFVFLARASLRGGRGEMELAKSDFPNQQVILARPDFSLSTASVYQQSQAEVWVGDRAIHSFPDQPEVNQLEAAAARLNPELACFANQLREVAPFQMTGSGSIFFWASPSAEESAKVMEQIQGFASWVIQTQLAVPTL